MNIDPLKPSAARPGDQLFLVTSDGTTEKTFTKRAGETTWQPYPPNPVEASTSTPDASTAPEPSRGVNGETRAKTQDEAPKDAPSGPQSPRSPSRVPAPLLDPLLWAIAITLVAICIAIPTYLILRGRP